MLELRPHLPSIHDTFTKANEWGTEGWRVFSYQAIMPTALSSIPSMAGKKQGLGDRIRHQMGMMWWDSTTGLSLQHKFVLLSHSIVLFWGVSAIVVGLFFSETGNKPRISSMAGKQSRCSISQWPQLTTYLVFLYLGSCLNFTHYFYGGWEGCSFHRAQVEVGGLALGAVLSLLYVGSWDWIQVVRSIGQVFSPTGLSQQCSVLKQGLSMYPRLAWNKTVYSPGSMNLWQFSSPILSNADIKGVHAFPAAFWVNLLLVCSCMDQTQGLRTLGKYSISEQHLQPSLSDYFLFGSSQKLHACQFTYPTTRLHAPNT